MGSSGVYEIIATGVEYRAVTMLWKGQRQFSAGQYHNRVLAISNMTLAYIEKCFGTCDSSTKVKLMVNQVLNIINLRISRPIYR